MRQAVALAVAAIALMLTAGPAMANDQYEPNEGYFEATDLISAGKSISAELDKPFTSETDFDHYRFFVGKAENPVTLTATSTGDPSAPLFIRLLDNGGYEQAPDQKMNPTGTISLTLPPGKYYVLIQDYTDEDWTGVAPYTLKTTGDLISRDQFEGQCTEARATLEGSEGALKKSGKQIKKAKKAVKKSKNKVKKARNKKAKSKAKKSLKKAKKSLKKGKAKKKKAVNASKGAEEFVNAC